MPNNLSHFWQELKRRNVVRVITVYAGAAFVIIELINNITEPLKLPEWTPTLIIVLLAIGFPIAIIISWIYDIHPEGGIVKTEPTQKASEASVPPSSKGWKIASYISFVVIAALIVLNIIPRTNTSKEAEFFDKSITVLPFISLSDDPEQQYLADGIMDAILLHLSKIEDLRVLARTTSEKYRDTDKTATEICQELGVSFALEGSFRKHGDQARLTVQLIRSGKEDHAWANQYDREWKEIFAVESEVAKAIARELQAVITPEEKQLIDNIPTTSLTAHDFYQRGKEEYWKYWVDNNDRAALERAEELFKEALEYDSNFALAFTGLARIYWEKRYWETFFTESFLDSVLILADKAIFIDPKLSDSYAVKGDYYREKGQNVQSIAEYEQAIKLNPNDWVSYLGLGRTYFDTNLVKAIENAQTAAFLNRGPELPRLLRLIGGCYYNAGFVDKSRYYYLEALKLDRDSVTYYNSMHNIEYLRGNYEKANEYAELAFAIDSTKPNTLENLGASYRRLGQTDIAIQFYQKWLQRLKELGQLKTNSMHRVAYAYWLGGFEDEAKYYFDEQLEYDNRMNDLGRGLAERKATYYNLACVYAFRGEEKKAFENLRIFNQRQMIPLWWVYYVKNDPLLDNIRDEPEFQQILRDVEAKYQAEHERVRQWLEENDML